MELVKNIASGKYFIVVDDADEQAIMVITPEGKVKSLERRLFGPQVSVENGFSDLDRRLTQRQLDKYGEYEAYVD